MDSRGRKTKLAWAVVLLFAGACGDDGADALGVGAQCTSNDQCDSATHQVCLMNFKGGYCGITNCMHDTDCPTDSKCVHHTDNMNYCFRTCLDKTECNANRDAVNESNCSSNITFVDPNTGIKACVPPSS
jgi:hypothetical protein